MRAQLLNSLTSLAKADHAEIREETKFTDIDRYLLSIRCDHDKIRIDDMEPFNRAIREITSLWILYHIRREELTDSLDRLTTDHPELKASAKLETGLKMPRTLLPTLRHGSPMTFSQDYTMPSLKDAVHLWLRATHQKQAVPDGSDIAEWWSILQTP